ncbi:MAG: FAD-dependent oxidoreductase [Clostridia bacterium]
MQSIWVKDRRFEEQNALKTDIERDIVVVGGGIAGYLTAFRLAEHGKRVTLVEAGALLAGVTQNTTAHISTLQGNTYSQLIKDSEVNAGLYFRAGQEAIFAYRDMVERYGIDCGFEMQDGYIYAAKGTSELKAEYRALKAIGADVEYLDAPELLGYKMTGAIRLKEQAIFEPLKFLGALPQNFEVFENTRITDVDFKKNILYAGNIKIKAEKIVIATNFPIIDFPGLYFLRMYKSASYAVQTDRVGDIGGMYQSIGENGLTCRNAKGGIITGGLDHRSGREKTSGKDKRLYERFRHLSENGTATHFWAANDCITFDRLPFVGYYSKKSRDIFVISGFNKWGMTNAMLASGLITDMICGRENHLEYLFSPQRKLSGIANYLKNTAVTILHLAIMPLLPAVKSYKKLKNGEGGIVCYKGKTKAVYKDEKGMLHICSPLCAHLKCRLSFNSDTLSWDCPCHGSRFTIDGEIITAPTVKNLDCHNTKS